MRERAHYPALTGLRAFAALWVVVFHYSYVAVRSSGTENPLAHIAAEGHLGVPIFFALSGFVITFTHADTFRREGLSHCREYFSRRFARIIPLYLACLIVAWILAIRAGQAPSLAAAATHLTLTQGFFNDFKYSGVGLAWTLTVEASFYALMPLLLGGLALAASRRQWTCIALRLLAACSLLLLLGFGLVGLVPHPGGFMGDDTLMLTRTIFGRAVEFAFGVASALAFMQIRAGDETALPRTPSVRAHAEAAALVLVIALLAYLLHQADSLDLSIGVNIGVAAVSAVICLHLATESSWLTRLLSWKPVIFGGLISYSLYLVHGLDRQAVETAFNRLLPSIPESWQPWPLVVFATLVSVAAATSLYYAVEVPCNRLLTRWLSARSGPGAQ